MKKIKELFEAEASSPSETALLHNGAVGFRIPEYQREYDWPKQNITRLYSARQKTPDFGRNRRFSRP